MEMEPKVSVKASISATEESEMSTNGTTATIKSASVDKLNGENNLIKKEIKPSVSASTSNLSHGSGLIQGEETVVKRDEASEIDPSSKEADRDRKFSSHSKNPPGKKKSKVDWTPELHKKFVQAVEQLGVDKAVPSRILELMGIDCLTRHNVASHLQKYRSHRKHVLAREAGQVSWNLRRQACGTMNRPGKRDANSWVVPSMGFPPTPPMPHYGPLHVWGHPSADQSLMYMWPLPTSTPTFNPPPGDPYSWYYHPQDVPATGMPYFSPHFAPTRYPTPMVPGISPSSMYRVDPGVGVPTMPTAHTLPQAPFDFQPSKENIDAVIGDVLSKPWLPLPLGLKPPSIDSVVVELQRQGISRIPPNCA